MILCCLMHLAAAETKRTMQHLFAASDWTERRPERVIWPKELYMKNLPMPSTAPTSTLDRMLALTRKSFSYRASVRVSPILIAFIAAMSALVGSAVTLTSARQIETRIPKGFDPSNSKSLADFLAMLCARSYRSSLPEEAPFLGGNMTAMSKMMTGMAITPSGNVDSDFVHMMVPHHQGAIDMAVLELHYGRNPILQRLAQEMIVDQQQEITAMYLAINEPLPASAPAPTWTDANPNTR
jgi:hypothetical protein